MSYKSRFSCTFSSANKALRNAEIAFHMHFLYDSGFPCSIFQFESYAKRFLFFVPIRPEKHNLAYLCRVLHMQTYAGSFIIVAHSYYPYGIARIFR